MQTGKFDFIVIDDNKVDCFIAEKTIEYSGRSRRSLVFHTAADALSYLSQPPSQPQTTIVLVDIQMPIMSGFQFVEFFESLALKDESLFHIYGLSSSINETDIAKLKHFRTVKGFLNKPITVEAIHEVVEAAI